MTMQSVDKLVNMVTGKERKPGIETCRNCGVSVIFKENQWRQRCPSCGITITIPRHKVIRITKTVNPPACFLCHDTGMIQYLAQSNDNLYDYSARCNCRAGQERRETGIPTADQVKDTMPDLRWLAQKNRLEWEKRHGKIGLELVEGAESVKVEDVPF